MLIKRKFAIAAIGCSFSFMIMPVAISQIATPFPSEDKVTAVDQTAATTAIQKQKEAGQALANSLNGIWDSLVTEEGSFFQDIIEGLNPLLTIGFAIWVLKTFPALLQRDGRPVPWGLLARPLIVMLLLSNGGTNLIALSQASRAVIYKVNDSILESTINGVNNRSHIQNAILSEAYERAATEKLATCNDEFEGKEREKCREDVLKQLEDLIKEAGGIPPEGFIESIGFYVSVGLQSVVIGGLATISALFHGVLAYGLAVFVVLSPVTIALTIIPMKFNGFQVYLAGIVSSGLMIIFYTGASAVTAALFAVPGNNALYILISAVANPFMAVGIGIAGFAGIYIGTGAAFKLVGGKLLG